MDFSKNKIIIILLGCLFFLSIFYPYVSVIIGYMLGVITKPIIDKWVKERDQRKIESLRKQLAKLENK